jgi:hypothetical protein
MAEPGPGVVGLGGVADRVAAGREGFAMVGLGGGGVLAPLGREEVGTLPPLAGLGAVGRGGAVGPAPPPAATTPPGLGRALGGGMLGGLGPGGKAGVAVIGVAVPEGGEASTAATPGGEASKAATPGGAPGGFPGGLGTWGLGGVEDISTDPGTETHKGRVREMLQTLQEFRSDAQDQKPASPSPAIIL